MRSIQWSLSTTSRTVRTTLTICFIEVKFNIIRSILLIWDTTIFKVVNNGSNLLKSSESEQDHTLHKPSAKLPCYKEVCSWSRYLRPATHSKFSNGNFTVSAALTAPASGGKIICILISFANGSLLVRYPDRYGWSAQNVIYPSLPSYFVASLLPSHHKYGMFRLLSSLLLQVFLAARRTCITWHNCRAWSSCRSCIRTCLRIIHNQV